MKNDIRNRSAQQHTRHNGLSHRFYNMNNPYRHDFDFLHYNDPRLYYHPEDEPVRWTRYERRHDPTMNEKAPHRHSHRLRNHDLHPVHRNIGGRWPEDTRNRETGRHYGRQFPEYREPYSPPYRENIREWRDERFYGAMEPEERRLWRDIDDEYTQH